VRLAARFRAALRRRHPVAAAPAGALPAPRRPLLALPAPPRTRPAAAPRHPVCPRCGDRHAPLPAPFGSWATSLLPRAGYVERAGQPADSTALQRDRFNPWRA